VHWSAVRVIGSVVSKDRTGLRWAARELDLAP